MGAHSTLGAEGKAEKPPLNLPATGGNGRHWVDVGTGDRKQPWEIVSSHPAVCQVPVETGYCGGQFRATAHQQCLETGKGEGFPATAGGQRCRPSMLPYPIRLVGGRMVLWAPALSLGSAFPARRCLEVPHRLPHLPWHCDLTSSLFPLPGGQAGSKPCLVQAGPAL